MKFKAILMVALAFACCLGADAQKTKKKKFKGTQPAVETVKPVPADTFSYAVGVAQAPSLKQYLMQREGVDTLYLADVVRGLKANLTEKEQKKFAAYAAGLKIAQMNREQVLPQLNNTATGNKDSVYTDFALFTEGPRRQQATQRRENHRERLAVSCTHYGHRRCSYRHFRSRGAL